MKKNYGTMGKTMVRWKNYILYICIENNENLIYYGKNYGTMKKLWYYSKL